MKKHSVDPPAAGADQISKLQRALAADIAEHGPIVLWIGDGAFPGTFLLGRVLRGLNLDHASLAMFVPELRSRRKPDPQPLSAADLFAEGQKILKERQK
jgi:hypothetical protein